MKCHDYQKRIPEFVSGSMSEVDNAGFEKHLESCWKCKEETEAFLQLEKLIGTAVVTVLPINLSAQILDKVRRPRRNTLGVVKDMIAAWAVAIILFWFSSPLLIGSGLPRYGEEVSRTSNKITTSFSEGYKAYIHYSFEAIGKVSEGFMKIGSEIMKGDEEYEMRKPSGN